MKITSKDLRITIASLKKQNDSAKILEKVMAAALESIFEVKEGTLLINSAKFNNWFEDFGIHIGKGELNKDNTDFLTLSLLSYEEDGIILPETYNKMKEALLNCNFIGLTKFDPYRQRLEITFELPVIFVD